MVNVTQCGDFYEIRFKYDPILISLIKNVPTRQWNAEGRFWSIHKDRLGWLLRELENTPYANQLNITSYEQINENAELDTTTVIPNIDISKIPFYIAKGCKPYSHQLDFMKYAIDRQQRGYMSGFLVADEMGLGKTLQLINLALYNKKQYKFKHCLVICCVNSSKYNWRADIQRHTNHKYDGYILGTRLKRDKVTERCDTTSAEKLKDLEVLRKYGSEKGDKLPYFIIMNIEAVRAKSGRKYPIADRLIELINSGEINMVCIDEVHKNCSMTALQGKQLQRIKKNTGTNCMWIPMTGTPITKKPTDVYLPLKLVDAHSFKDYYGWCNNFCIYGGFGGHEIVGYKNIPRLKDMLQGSMIRRRKEDVLDLPDKIYFEEYVDNTSYQETLYQKTQRQIASDVTNPQLAINPLAMFLRLRQVNGSPELVDDVLRIKLKSPQLPQTVRSEYLKKNAKLARLMEILDDIAERGEKVLVFSNWVEPLRTLYKFVSVKYKVCCFTGTMSDADREKHKRVFMTNPKYTVMIGTIGAMGTTHTLTAANNVIFYDEPWNPSDKVQAEDRIHRISQKQSVNVYTLLTRNTVDERVHQILYDKENISKYIVDNKLDFKNNPGLYQYLLEGKLPKS